MPLYCSWNCFPDKEKPIIYNHQKPVLMFLYFIMSITAKISFAGISCIITFSFYVAYLGMILGIFYLLDIPQKIETFAGVLSAILNPILNYIIHKIIIIYMYIYLFHLVLSVFVTHLGSCGIISITSLYIYVFFPCFLYIFPFFMLIDSLVFSVFLFLLSSRSITYPVFSFNMTLDQVILFHNK